MTNDSNPEFNDKANEEQDRPLVLHCYKISYPSITWIMNFLTNMTYNLIIELSNRAHQIYFKRKMGTRWTFGTRLCTNSGTDFFE